MNKSMVVGMEACSDWGSLDNEAPHHWTCDNKQTPYTLLLMISFLKFRQNWIFRPNNSLGRLETTPSSYESSEKQTHA